MHTSTTTELPHLTLGTLIALRPFTVAELREAVLPYIPEAIAVDISLGVVCAYARTSRDVAINANRRYIHTRVTHIEMVTHFALVAPQEALAGVVEVYASLLACGADKLHKLTELLLVEVQSLIALGTSRRED